MKIQNLILEWSVLTVGLSTIPLMTKVLFFINYTGSEEIFKCVDFAIVNIILQLNTIRNVNDISFQDKVIQKINSSSIVILLIYSAVLLGFSYTQTIEKASEYNHNTLLNVNIVFVIVSLIYSFGVYYIIYQNRIKNKVAA